MASDQTIETARALFDAFNKHDFTIWERSTSTDLVADYPNAHNLNKEAARGYNLSFFNATDDARFVVQNVMSNGSLVAFQATVSATMHHPLVTPAGTFPATGKGGSIPFVLIAEVRDGKIVKEQAVWDELEWLRIWGIGG